MQLFSYPGKNLKPRHRFFLMLILFVLLSCNSQDSADSEKHQENATRNPSFTAAQQIGRLPATDNPIAHALGLLKLEHADLHRPLAHEEGYNLIARNPLIDHVAASPFHLHRWADTNSKRLQEKAQSGMQPGLAHLIALLNGGVSYSQRVETAKSSVGVAEAYTRLCQQSGTVPRQAVLENIQRIGFADDFDRQLAALIDQLSAGAKLTQKAFAGLDPQELAFLKARPERFFFPDG